MTPGSASPAAARIALGTAQLGLDYGATNVTGRVADDEATRIVARALQAGIHLFDTAPGYGDSEMVLGRCLPAHAGDVITKTPPIEVEAIDRTAVDAIVTAARRSMTRLQRDHLHALLLHRAGDLSRPGAERLVDGLLQLRADGVIARIGASVYDAAEIDIVLASFTPDLVQLPFSVADQRLLHSGHLGELARRGVAVHARSLFLQGILLQPPDGWEQLAPTIAILDEVERSTGVTRVQTCLRFALDRPEVEAAVVGVTSQRELDCIIAAADASVALPDLSAAAVDAIEIVDPRRWAPAATTGGRA